LGAVTTGPSSRNLAYIPSSTSVTICDARVPLPGVWLEDFTVSPRFLRLSCSHHREAI
jgi:hypothetical protein